VDQKNATPQADILGAWTLVDWRRTGPNPYPYGEGARGSLCYDAGGFVFAHLMRADWGTTGIAAGEGFMAYSGRWSVVGAEVHHAVETASIPAWVGTTLVREWSFGENGDLILFTPWRDSRVGRTRDQLVWRRRR
jgi:hypothetical protein